MKNGSLSKKRQKSFWRRHRVLTAICLVMVGLLISLIVIITVICLQTKHRQDTLAPFYDTTGLQTQGAMGEIMRQEPLGVTVPGGEGYRVLYRTQKADGSNTFSSGMVFIPNSTAESRPVLAWAHGTMGFGAQCAPTRTKNPADMSWLGDALSQGWVVTATDYAGFGTPGTQEYLVGASEAHDVINSVRAARNLKEAKAGNQYAVWGHSQGGNSALFTANMSPSYAPELDLQATVASAPAAELPELLNEQYNTAADWAIGPLVAISWPAVNPNLQADQILTSLGQKTYKKIANQCIEVSALGGVVRNALGQKFFTQNPIDVPEWGVMAAQQSAPYLNKEQPVLVVESEEDKVVLPNTTALYIQEACKAGSNLDSLWIAKGNHMQIPKLTYQQVIPWIKDRMGGQPNPSACGETLPVTPAQAS